MKGYLVITLFLRKGTVQYFRPGPRNGLQESSAQTPYVLWYYFCRWYLPPWYAAGARPLTISWMGEVPCLLYLALCQRSRRQVWVAMRRLRPSFDHCAPPSTSPSTLSPRPGGHPTNSFARLRGATLRGSTISTSLWSTWMALFPFFTPSLFSREASTRGFQANIWVVKRDILVNMIPTLVKLTPLHFSLNASFWGTGRT